MLGIHYFIGVFVIALFGVGLSYLIFPSNNELAFMNLQDKRYDEARTKYLQQWEDGDRSLSVSMPLSKLHLQTGNVAKAIEVLEELVSKQPDNIEAREQLGVYYKYDQQSDKYLENLENLRRLKPTAPVLRELADIYNYQGDYDKQIAVLTELTTNFDFNRDDLQHLVYLLALKKQYKQAVATIDRLIKQMPRPLDYGTIELAVSLYLDNGEPQRAIKHAREYSDKNKKKYNQIIGLTEIFNTHGAIEEALVFIEPYSQLKHPDIEESYLSVLSKQTDVLPFKRIINTKIAQSDNTKRLEIYAQMALGEDLYSEAERAYTKIVTIDPFFTSAYRQLGELLYHAKKYAQSMKFFAKHHNEYDGDYESNYMHGDLLWRNKQKQKARSHFETSLNLLKRVKEPTYEDSIIQAQMYNYTGQHEESFTIYRTLIKQYPKNMDIVTDFADLLMDRLHYEEAESIIRAAQIIRWSQHAS